MGKKSMDIVNVIRNEIRSCFASEEMSKILDRSVERLLKEKLEGFESELKLANEKIHILEAALLEQNKKVEKLEKLFEETNKGIIAKYGDAEEKERSRSKVMLNIPEYKSCFELDKTKCDHQAVNMVMQHLNPGVTETTQSSSAERNQLMMNDQREKMAGAGHSSKTSISSCTGIYKADVIKNVRVHKFVRTLKQFYMGTGAEPNDNVAKLIDSKLGYFYQRARISPQKFMTTIDFLFITVIQMGVDASQYSTTNTLELEKILDGFEELMDQFSFSLTTHTQEKWSALRTKSNNDLSLFVRHTDMDSLFGYILGGLC